MSEILIKRTSKRKDVLTGEDIERGTDGLFPRHRRFCEEYVKDFDSRAAAVRAGFKNSSRLLASTGKILNNKYAAEYIRELMDRLREKSEIDTLWIVNKAKTIIERCVPDDVTDRENFNPRAAISGLDLLKGYTGGFDKNNPKDDGRSSTINIYSIEAREKVRGILENVRNLREIKPISIE